MTESELIEACRRNDRTAQKLLFEQYAPFMLGLCRRYVGVHEDAEDVMLRGFFKVFDKIDYYKGEGSFEGWIRRIMVNESLMFLRLKQQLRYSEDVQEYHLSDEEPGVVDKLSAEEIIALIDEMPPGYKTVFNLFMIEGYKHREIAEELGISINTSKSQLILAKQRMMKLVQKHLGIEKFEKE